MTSPGASPLALPLAIDRLRRLIAGAVAIAVVVGCVASPPGSAGPSSSVPTPAVVAASPTPTPTPSPSVEACPSQAPSPTPEASLPPDVDAATRTAVRIRTEYGLRRDLAWIRSVAGDPTRSMAFGTALLPAEEATLFARSELPTPVLAALGRHGHTDEFGGLYIDNAQVRVVTLWTTDPAVHEAAIRPLLPACHPVAFLRVRWSERELRTWQDRISNDTEWAESIPARIIGIGADITDNVVAVEISSANPQAPALVVAHYGDAPNGMIRVESDGTGAHLLPFGTVVGTVVRSDGSPVGPNDLMLDAGSPVDPPGWCGGGDIGYGVREDGRFEYPCAVGRRTILVKDWVATEGGDHPVVASVVVDVPAGGEVRVRIRLPVGFDPSATP